MVIDVVKSVARMGDNDLLASHEVRIDPEGEPLNVTRTRCNTAKIGISHEL